MENQFREISYIRTKEALEIVNDKGVVPVSLPTLISWIRTYKIGKKVGGRWWIDKQKLIKMLQDGNSDGEEN